ncbi:APO protein 4 [Pyrus ussuriensis x Pyrus communis]|uniref:APO protein 4 n=1 Tax=Pyrus ussuriensis x Pyrus communis TaxID=2448454 RepID=A0A5N5GJA8_9ROSA|nr:APO protein 4 [Pyrus ussuriensis x Pyrus communis]
MALRKKLCDRSNFNGKIMDCFARYYSLKMGLRKLKPMIQKRIQNRAKDYPVLDSRRLIMQGVSTLLKMVQVNPSSAKFCPEVYIGEKGHLIQTCCGFKRRGKNRVHEWIIGGFDFECVPAVVELCWQAGANDGNHLNWNSESDCVGVDGVESLSSDELILVASGTLRAWEILRNGVEKLLMVYPAKICKHCSEVHVGPSGHKARLGFAEFLSMRTLWRRRPQDPQVLLNEGRGYYGHAPAVVELCTRASAIAPPKYHGMMKLQGVSTTLGDQRLLHPNDQM